MFTTRHCFVFKVTLTRVSYILHHVLSHMNDIITPSWNEFSDTICNKYEEKFMSKNLVSTSRIFL